MVKLSNSLIGILNFITFLLSIPILGAGIWLASKGDSVCEKFLQYPVIAIGVLLMLVSIAGLVGACCRVSWILWIYLLVMFLLIILLFCFTIFAFVVTNKGAGEAVSNRGYKDYRLGDYSDWLQKRVEKSSNWRKIKSCLEDAKVCKSLEEDAINDAAEQFYRRNLSPIQSGCCKPPTECNFSFVNVTFWSPPASFNSSNVDCMTWKNDLDQLCYNCNSCKAGVLDNLKHEWRKIAIVNVIVLIALIVVYSIGCCAFRNNRSDDNNNRYPYKGYP